MRVIIALFFLSLSFNLFANTKLTGFIQAQPYGLANPLYELKKVFPANSYEFLAPIKNLKFESHSNQNILYLMSSIQLKLITRKKQNFEYKLIPDNKIYVIDNKGNTTIVEGKISLNKEVTIRGSLENNDNIKIANPGFSITSKKSAYLYSFVLHLKNPIPVVVELFN